MAIAVRNLTKEYGSQKAVDDISFDVNTGEILGFLGPNGAGKTTLFNLITGQLTPDNGKILLNDEDISKLPPH
ncbi:MAG: ATP-binding cassette domain-containing protein, partial [Bacteroidetes bacterium]|nr:ATP-binding cassette domain-containing protein [Bacteroidota bacterium]